MADRCRHYPNQPCPLPNLQCQAPECFEPLSTNMFVSKPQRVEAVQWTGDNVDDVLRFAADKSMFRHFGPDSIDAGLWLLAGKDGAQEWVPVPIGHWLVHPPGDLSDIWPVEDVYFREKYQETS